MRSHNTEFPGSNVPVLPMGWIDESWHNDTMPKFTFQGKDRFYLLWVDFENISDREDCGEAPRFLLYEYSNPDDCWDQVDPIESTFSDDLNYILGLVI